MLRLQRIDIEKFACFDKLVVEPSTDPDRRLTVIRAENGSGKTTFLRAVRWGMYGERGLPADAGNFSLHPTWWSPDKAGIETRVIIEFETDGSSRHYAENGTQTRLYQIVRSVRTVAKLARRASEADFRRINERTRLMIREPTGEWNEHTTAPDLIVSELLPWELRDFFIMDTDEVADFVGGSENKVISRSDVETKTTHAVHSLLGIEVFKMTRERVEKIARSFGKQATIAIGDHDLNELQDSLDRKRAEQEELQASLREESSRRSELTDRWERARDDLEKELRKSGSHENLREQLARNQGRYKKVLKERSKYLTLLSSSLESLDLLAPLSSDAISATYKTLKPLHEQGHIPAIHLNFVRGLLKSGRCVCGRNLAIEDEHRHQIENQLAESSAQEKRASFLYHLHDAALALCGHLNGYDWLDNLLTHRAELAATVKELDDLALEKKDVDAKLEKIDESKIQLHKEEIEALETQMQDCDRSLTCQQLKLPDLEKEIMSLNRKISQRQRKERAAAAHREAEQLSQFVIEILNRAYLTIERAQVGELSARMNRLFLQMAANVSDDDFVETQSNKVTIRMISNVGVRQVEGRADLYEIFALNSRGRAMPPVEINGASRRVLALAFVLALCIESQTRAPLIADSLLNFMSGAVRRNTLRVTSEHSQQPILLLTGSDLQAASEAEIVEQYAGATYTLTGQWDAVEARSGGDVVNWTDRRGVALLCTCGPRQYCSICERIGQAGTPGWMRRES